MPDYVIDSLEGLDPAVASLYTEKDGKFIATGITGVAQKSVVDEFRNNNIELKNTLKTFEGINPKEVATLKQENDEMKIRLDKEVLDEDQIDEIVKGRVATIVGEHETVVQTLNEQLNESTGFVQELVLTSAVQAAAAANGVEETAIDDVTLRASRVFKVEGKEPVAYNGDEKLYDATGSEGLSVNDWVKGLKESAPHLFKPSQDTGMRGGGRPGSPGSGQMSSLQKIAGGL